MVLCDNFIYTTASTRERLGYQVIAKSEGVTEEILNELGGYYYPTGIVSEQFTEANTLLMLKNEKIAFSMIKNIGMGFDGRENTLYNYTIILDKKQFENLNYDSRILASYFIKTTEARGLQKIDIEEKSMEPAWEYIQTIPQNIIESVFDQIFSKKKIAISGINDINFFPNIISFLPKSMKIIPFSTFTIQPVKQSKFNMVQLANNAESTLDSEYVKIDVPNLMPFYKNDEDTMFERSIKIFVDILLNRKKESLENIQKEFEDIPSPNIKNKLKLITYYEQIRKENNKNKCEKYARDILNILDYFDEETTVKYLLKIKEFLEEEEYRKYLKQIELNQIITKFSNKDINFLNIKEMFNSLNDWSYESRDSIFSQLIKKNIEKIKKNGTQILLDARFTFNEVILDNFVRKKELHENILEVFDEKTKLDPYYKQGYLEYIVERIAKQDSNLTLELLKKPVFDFSDEYNSRHYKNILKIILKNEEFIEKINPAELLKLIEVVFEKIKKTIEYKSSSGIVKITNSNLQELTKILNEFGKSLEFFKSKELGSQLHKKLSMQKDEINSFLEKHKPRSTLSSLQDF